MTRFEGRTCPPSPRFLDRLSGEPGSLIPARPLAPDGSPRAIGVELEFAGLGPRRAADVVAGSLGGDVRERTEYELEIDVPALGPFHVEVDHQRLKDLGRARAEGEDPGLVETLEENVLSVLSGSLTPVEIATAPLAPEQLGRLDDLAHFLTLAGARGTTEGLFYAFGTHYNPAVASENPEDLLAHMQAYAVLEPWLRERLDVDTSRRATNFIDPWPRHYVESLLRRERVSSIQELVDDYLASNPTRNRALDMLPLFAHLDPERVGQHLDDPRIKARPTFHYRLTDCRLGERGWKVTDGYRLWLIVEDLAADRERLADMRREALAPVSRSKSDWMRRTVEWLS